MAFRTLAPSVEILAIADDYEAGLNRALASGYAEFGVTWERRQRIIIAALHLAASIQNSDVRNTAQAATSHPVPTANAMAGRNAAAQFVMWALMEGSWQGADIDGGAAQDKAEALGLITATAYDPAIHGASDSSEPGDTWYVPSEAMLAALTPPSPTPTEPPPYEGGTSGYGLEPS